MKTCENCLWRDQCPDTGERCEYYDSTDGAENIAIKEYYQDLDERHKEYQELIREQQDDYYGG